MVRSHRAASEGGLCVSIDTQVIHSIPPLDEAALEAVRQWEYRPSLLNGKPTPVMMTVNLNFARP